MAAPRLYSTFLLRMLSELFERLPEVGDQKAIRTVAQTFRANPSLDSERVLQELEVGEALTSILNARGEPSMAQRTLIRPPMSRVGALSADGRQAQIGNDFARATKYGKRLDQPSARERLQERHSPIGQFKHKARRFGRLFVVPGAKG